MARLAAAAVGALLLLAAASAAPSSGASSAISSGGPARMVSDIRTQSGYELGSFEWDEYTEIGGVFYFASDDGVHGREPWRWVPGEEPVMLADLCPGVCGSRPRHLTPFNGRLFFSAEDGTHGREPWLSDGTRRGTRLIRDVVLGASHSYPDFPVVLGDRLFFAAGGNNSDDRELWTSDGTEGGTQRLLDIEPGPVGSGPVSITVLEDRLYFAAWTTAAGRELWSSDGSAAGTQMVLDHCPGDCDAFWPEQWTPLGDSRALQEFDGRLLVLASDDFGSSYGLHVLETDTPALSLLNSEVRGVWAPFPRIGGRFFFNGCDDVAGCELWASDATPAGTFRVADIFPGVLGSTPSQLGVLGEELLFFAEDGSSGSELWKSDGTETGTQRVADIHGGPASSRPFLDRFPALRVNERLVFRADDGVHGDEYWTTDGTPEGTELLIDIFPGPEPSLAWGGFGQHLVTNGAGWISASNPSAGFATWSTDGTPAGTELFLDANRQASAIELQAVRFLPNFYAGAFADALLFAADDGEYGQELWVTDGSDGGTRLVADLAPGEVIPGLSRSSEPRYFADGAGPGLVGTVGEGVWAVDRQASTAVQLSEGSIQGPFLPRPAGQSGGFYVEHSQSNGNELVVTDGTPGGTQTLVGDVEGSPALLGESVLLFGRDVAPWGRELWAYPLPGGPPELVADINPGGASSSPGILGRLEGEVLFAATHPTFGRELWATDGTAEGTRLVRDIAPGTLDGAPRVLSYDVPAPTTSQGLYFLADDGASGRELWFTDGSEGGTRLVLDLWPGPASSGVDQAVTTTDSVYFVGDDGVHGRELWVAEAGRARLIRDIHKGPGSSIPPHPGPRMLGAIGERVFFGATEGRQGVELWTTDGSRDGTRLLQDIHPGSRSSSPGGFINAGGRLYFTANDGTHGFEVWSLRHDFELFSDGFESGDTTRWSVTVPPR